jgi:catechol-2,3-dioxygenase
MHDSLMSERPRFAALSSFVQPRIVRLELMCSAAMPEMKRFYHDLLGLPVVDDEPDRLTIDAGQTRISFMRSTDSGPAPFYHFAFNIPENKILSAHRWQKERTDLLPIPERLRDPKYPDDVVDYRHWNAHSVFFFDPAGNVVEYIARHDLENTADGDFNSEDIHYASEIAFVVDDVEATADKLKVIAGVDQYRRASEQFAALGDEHGLLLVMHRDRVISFDSPEVKAVSVFPTTAVIRGNHRSTFEHDGFPYKIVVND